MVVSNTQVKYKTKKIDLKFQKKSGTNLQMNAKLSYSVTPT